MLLVNPPILKVGSRDGIKKRVGATMLGGLPERSIQGQLQQKNPGSAEFEPPIKKNQTSHVTKSYKLWNPNGNIYPVAPIAQATTLDPILRFIEPPINLIREVYMNQYRCPRSPMAVAAYIIPTEVP